MKQSDGINTAKSTAKQALNMTIETSEIGNKRALSDRRDADRRQIVRRSANEHVDLERRRADFRRGLQRRMLARRSR